MAEKGTEKKGNKSAIIVAILVIIIIIQGIKIYMDHQKKNEQEEQIATTEEELAITMQRFTDISKELDEKIAEIERLGGDVTELQEAKAEIEAELKRTRTANASTIATLRARVSGYEELLNEKDKEITRLQAINDELLSENTTLKEEKNVLNTQIQELDKTQTELSEKVQIASQLDIENLRVVAVNRRGKERVSPFKNRHIDELRVIFDITENKVAPIEGKEIMIRIIDQNGQVFFDVDKGSGTFMIDGKEMFYTKKEEVLYDRTRQTLTIPYDKGSDWEDGKYAVEIYTDDYLMGGGTFDVK
jgi:ribosomal protein L24